MANIIAAAFPYPPTAVTAEDKCACAIRTRHRLRLAHNAHPLKLAAESARAAFVAAVVAANGGKPYVVGAYLGKPIYLDESSAGAHWKKVRKLAPVECAAYRAAVTKFTAWRAADYAPRRKRAEAEKNAQIVAAGLDVPGDLPLDSPEREAKETARDAFKAVAKEDTRWDSVDLEAVAEEP